MTAIPAADVTRVRYPHARITDVKLFIAEIKESASATISAVPTAFPQGDYSVSGASASWLDQTIGQYVRLYNSAGTILKYEGALRRFNNNTTTVRINWRGEGDTGYAQEFARVLAVGDIVRIYDNIVPFATVSRFDPVTQDVLKRGDNQYINQTIMPPVQVNLKGSQWAYVDPVTGKATFVLDASASFSFTAGTLSYLWTLPAGLTLKTGFSLTDAIIEVEAEPGQYRPSVLVDVAGGQEKLASIYLYAVEPGVFDAFSDKYPIVAIENDVTDRRGWKCTFMIECNSSDFDDLREKYLVTGNQVLFSYTWQFRPDGNATWQNLSQDGRKRFIGNIRRYDEIYAENGDIRGVRIDVEGILHYCDSLPLANQTLVEKETPTKWWQVAVALNHVAYMLYYLINEHARQVMVFNDFYNDDNAQAFRRAAINIRAGSITSGMQSVISLIPGANVGATNEGFIYNRRHISLENTAFRSSKPNRFTFTDQDILSDLRYERDLVMEQGTVEGGAFVWASGGNSVAYLARTGLLAQQLGTGALRMPDFIGLSQADMQLRVGNYAAYVNRPTRTISFDIGFDLIDPVLMTPCLLSVAAYDPLDCGIMAGRVIPERVSRTWSLDTPGLPPRVTLTVEPETAGVPAPLVPDKPISQIFVNNCGNSINANWRESASDFNFVAINTVAGSPIVSDFPDMAIGVYSGYGTRVFDTTRRLDTGWHTPLCGNSGCRACGVQRIFNQPFRLCNVQGNAQLLDSSFVISNARGRALGIYIMRVNETTWTQIAYHAIGTHVSGANVATWSGSELITRIALVTLHLDGAPFPTAQMSIRSITINI